MTNIYSEIYNLIIGLFGGSSAPPFADSLCIMLSCFCVLFVLLIPFIILFNILKYFSR